MGRPVTPVSETLLRTFVAVAEEHSFSRAGERLNMAQPAVSQQIRRLEMQLGVMVLRRNSRNVGLTPAGELLLRNVAPALAGLDEALARFDESRETPRPLRVSHPSSLSPVVMPTAAAALSKSDHTVSFTPVELSADAGLAQLRTNDIDVAVMFAGSDAMELDSFDRQVLHDGPAYVALPVDHPLCCRSSVHLSDLHHERWILAGRPADHVTRNMMLQRFRRSSVKPLVVGEAATIRDFSAWSPQVSVSVSLCRTQDLWAPAPCWCLSSTNG